MKYINIQKGKILAKRDELFTDPGNGIFKSKPWPFVLYDCTKNIYAPFLEDSVAYFKDAGIGFWNANGDYPSGHLLSSQVACVNHLFGLRNDQQAATTVLKAIDDDASKALAIDEEGVNPGFVAFEVIGKKNYLGEKSHTRGANSTSIDAMMAAELQDGSVRLYFIEWKYTESYTSLSKAEGPSGKTRLRIYRPLLEKQDSPLKQLDDITPLFIEPYYQLMRQTLLAHEIVKANEWGATSYKHIHAIPEANINLKEKNTSPVLEGANLDEAWKNILKDSSKYLAIDPELLLSPLKNSDKHMSWITYLSNRYWDI